MRVGEVTSLDQSKAQEEHSATFVLRLGHALHASGYAAHSLEDVLLHVCDRLGIIAQFFTTPTAIMAAFGPLEKQRTHLIRVQPGELNLGRLSELDEVAHEVLHGTLTPQAGSAAIAQIVVRRPTYPWWLRVFGYAIVSAAGCRFLGGGWDDVATGAAIGLVIGLLALGFKRLTIGSHVFELTAATVASALAALVAARGLHVSIPTTTLAGVITLLPGLTITVAMTELASRHLSSGSARLGSAFIIFATLTFGVAIGSTVVTSLHGAPIRSYAPEPLPDWTRFVALCIAPFGFALLLRARPRDIPLVCGASWLGYVGFQLGADTLGQVLGASIGTLTVGLASNLFERFELGPASVPLVPGVLLLVPGSIGYRSLTMLLTENVQSGLTAGVTAILTAVALAGGLIVANVLVPPTK
jgi:uncharacterized membrane protein YjjP (DUF1212 family)